VFRLSHQFCDLSRPPIHIAKIFRFLANTIIYLAASISRCQIELSHDLHRCLVALIAGMVSLGSYSDLFATDIAQPILGKPVVGWNGNYIVGRWTPVWVPVTVPDSGSLSMELTAVDPDGNRVNFLSTPTDVKQGAQHLEGLFRVGRLDGEVAVTVGGVTSRGIPDRTDWLKSPLEPSTRLIVTVGEPRGFDFETKTPNQGSKINIATMKAAELPTNSLAYDGLTSLVLAGTTEVPEAQSNSIRDWVASGGRLVISLPNDSATARRVLMKWSPITVGEKPVTVREFGSLEAFAAKNLRIPQTSALSIPNLEFEVGEILAASRSVPFLVRAPFGMGSVTVLALDLTTNPLSGWKGLSAFCSRLSISDGRTDASDKGVNKGSQLSSTGITDLSTQLHAVQENFEKIRRASPWFVMACLLSLLIVVGPIDYLIVHRILRRPHLTWVTFPLFAAAGTLLASSFATASNQTSYRANQLNLVNIDVALASARGRHFVNLYSPTTSQTSISIQPESLVSGSNFKPAARVIWQGVPESTFGGMLRRTGLENGATYQQQPGGEMTDVPLLQWSSKELVGESVQSAEGLVDCNLKASATGSLSGTILHRFSSPIEDWMIVYQNRVYRHLKARDDSQPLPLPPRQVWRVEQPGVFQRELRPFLTGILTMATDRFGSRTSEVVRQKSNYDPLSRDPLELIRILTFHTELGGEQYTGLTNHLLEEEDCSHLLKLGRAILFGRLNQSLASIEKNHQPLEPDRQNSFVRLIIPVTKSGEVMKELKRVLPD
jgi:hypothetical protein